MTALLFVIAAAQFCLIVHSCCGGALLARGRLRQRMLDWQSRRSGPERKEVDMNWNIVEGTWKQFNGQGKTQWSRLTHDHPDVIVGKPVELAAKIQEASPETECKTKEEIPPRRLVLRGALG